MTAEAVSDDTPPSQSRFTRAMLFGAAALVLLLVVAVFAGRYFDFEEAIWIQRIEDEIQSCLTSAPLGQIEVIA